MRRSNFRYNIVTNGIRILFIILFVYTATSKLLMLEEFKTQLEKAPYLSTYAIFLAWGIPLFEYIITILFLFQKLIHIALYLSLGIMLVFTLYIFQVLNFSDSIPCACGGVISALGWKAHFIFNILFTVLALIGVILYNNQKNSFIKNFTT